MTIFTAVRVRGGLLGEVLAAFPLAEPYVRGRAEKRNKTSAEQSVCGLYALLLLLRRAGEDTTRLRFGAERGGKPYLEGSRLHFSVSHSASLAVCALSDAPVGADVEKVREMPDAAMLADRFFSADEAAAVRSANDPSRELLRIWTRKEALIKREGKGIDAVLSGIDVSGRFTEREMTTDGETYLVCVTGEAECMSFTEGSI